MYKTIDEIIAANEALGHGFFDPTTMGFFDSKVESDVLAGRFFVTSERSARSFGGAGQAWGGKRRYTLRVARDDGSIESAGEFGEYAELSEAVAALRQALDAGVSVTPSDASEHFELWIGEVKGRGLRVSRWLDETDAEAFADEIGEALKATEMA